MPEHSLITDPNLHEPKGISNAAQGQVYIADGNGSGEWEPFPGAGDSFYGWGQYQDSRRDSVTPTQTIATGNRAKFLCNGNFLTKEYLPSDASVPLWDIVNNQHVPVAEDDTYDLRFSFTAENYAGTGSYLVCELDIGGTLGVIVSQTFPLLRNGDAQTFVFAFPVYTADTYIANNGEMFITYSGTGSVDLHSNGVFIERRGKVNV